MPAACTSALMCCTADLLVGSGAGLEGVRASDESMAPCVRISSAAGLKTVCCAIRYEPWQSHRGTKAGQHVDHRQMQMP